MQIPENSPTVSITLQISTTYRLKSMNRKS